MKYLNQSNAYIAVNLRISIHCSFHCYMSDGLRKHDNKSKLTRNMLKNSLLQTEDTYHKKITKSQITITNFISRHGWIFFYVGRGIRIAINDFPAIIMYYTMREFQEKWYFFLILFFKTWDRAVQSCSCEPHF